MLFWKKDKPATSGQPNTKTHEFADLNLEDLGSVSNKNEIKSNPEIEQYLDHDAKISSQTKAYLQNQQTKVLELDDLENLLNEQQTTDEVSTNMEINNSQEDYQSIVKKQEEQLKYEFIEPLLNKPIQDLSPDNIAPIINQVSTWDFEKLVAIFEPKINLRIHKTEKRNLSN